MNIHQFKTKIITYDILFGNFISLRSIIRLVKRLKKTHQTQGKITVRFSATRDQIVLSPWSSFVNVGYRVETLSCLWSSQQLYNKINASMTRKVEQKFLSSLRRSRPPHVARPLLRSSPLTESLEQASVSQFLRFARRREGPHTSPGFRKYRLLVLEIMV